MEHKEINLYLSRILSGFYIFLFQNTKYKLVYPNISVKYEAEIYASNEYENNKYNTWITDEDIVNMLIDVGLWNYNGDEQLKKMEQEIEDNKVELFKNILNPNKIKSIRRSLSNIRHSYYKYTNIRHSLDHLTSQGFATTLKNQYLLINSIRDMNDNLVFSDMINVDYLVVNNMSSIINDNIIDVSILKKIARNELWRNYWSCNKNNIFDKSPINWTDEQRTLVLFTKMYDSAYEHPECPQDSVIEDDDMFDGWMILQRRENEKIRSKKRAEKILDGKKLNNAQEVFLMASSKEEADNIYNLNNASSRHIINERNNVILSSDQEISETNLPDVLRNLQMQSNKQAMSVGKQ